MTYKITIVDREIEDIKSFKTSSKKELKFLLNKFLHTEFELNARIYHQRFVSFLSFNQEKINNSIYQEEEWIWTVYVEERKEC